MPSGAMCEGVPISALDIDVMGIFYTHTHTRTHTHTALRCHCNETHSHVAPHCFDNAFTCEVTEGLCYAQIFVSEESATVQRRWGCLSEDLLCGQTDSATRQVRCCNDSDLCNKWLELHLPPPTPQVSSEPTSVTGGTAEEQPGSSCKCVCPGPVVPGLTVLLRLHVADVAKPQVQAETALHTHTTTGKCSQHMRWYKPLSCTRVLTSANG